MTFILGSHCKDGVILVADRKITIDGGEDYDECDKLFGEISCYGLYQCTNENHQQKYEVGRVGFEPTTPAMSRRYLNQARPPAPYTD
jgi:hypothetical protein